MLKKKTLTAMFSLALAWHDGAPRLRSGGDSRPTGGGDSSQAPDCRGPNSGFAPGRRRASAHPGGAGFGPPRAGGKPSVNFAMRYTDVDREAEYAEAVRWAASQGIACGYGRRDLRPGRHGHPEQMAVILYRYAQSKDQGFTGAWAFPPLRRCGEVSSLCL